MRHRSWVAVVMVLVVLVGVVPRPASANPGVGVAVGRLMEGIFAGVVGSCLYDWSNCKKKVQGTVRDATDSHMDNQRQFVDEYDQKGFNCDYGWVSNCRFDAKKYERQQQRYQEDAPWMGW